MIRQIRDAINWKIVATVVGTVVAVATAGGGTLWKVSDWRVNVDRDVQVNTEHISELQVDFAQLDDRSRVVERDIAGIAENVKTLVKASEKSE